MRIRLPRLLQGCVNQQRFVAYFGFHKLRVPERYRALSLAIQPQAESVGGSLSASGVIWPGARRSGLEPRVNGWAITCG